MKRQKIDNFQGEFRFLSNFFPCTVRYDELVYPSAEHAYQSMKTTSKTIQGWFTAKNMSPGEAKDMARKLVSIKPTWNDIRLRIMEEVLRAKFTQNKDLRDLLLDTGDAHLEEGNSWGDTFWGTHHGVGENNLGKLLMKIRKELSQ